MPVLPPLRRPCGRSRHVAGALALLVLLAGCGVFTGASGDISQGELLIELSDTINELRAHDAMLQEELDGLRAELARQDTLLTRLAAAGGVALPR